MKYHICRSFVIAVHAVIIFLLLPYIAGDTSCRTLDSGRLTLGLDSQVEGAAPPLEVLIDTSRTLTLDDILDRPELARGFAPSATAIINPGFARAAFWIRFRLHNAGSSGGRYLIEVPSPLIDVVDLYTPTFAGTFTKRQGGELIPLDNREIQHRKPLFFINLAPEEEITAYIRFLDLGSVPLSIRIWDPKAYALHSAQERYHLGMYYGAIFIILFYNLILFLMVRIPSYIYYVIYGISFLFWQLTYNGLATEYLWAKHPWITNHTIPILICMTGISALQFSRVFLETKRLAPNFDLLLRTLMGAFAAILPLSFFRDYTYGIALAAFFAVVFSPVVLAASIISWKKGYRPARYFTIAWFSLLCGTAILGLKSFGLLPSNFSTEYGQQIGSFAEILLLSLALADQVNIMKQEREAAKAAMIEAQQEANVLLGKKVSERTRELEQSNKKLEILSMKLAKYLSPQLYTSIFSGKTDVLQKPSRKLLTIFFSDIKGFTDMTDAMEPETLTEMLNFYLDEMAKIALIHGGTIDKYIGDAMLVFFGDPETNGAREDAMSCLKMAISMQDRIRELRADNVGNAIGLPPSFEVRIGINTGYCTVGNFGSEERLDYTIVGGQVNLANRLEGVAAPGRILISEATWRLVKDSIDCEAMGELKLKGIARPVSSYRVLEKKERSQSATEVIVEKGEGYRIEIAPAKLDPEEGGRRLKDAIERILQKTRPWIE